MIFVHAVVHTGKSSEDKNVNYEYRLQNDIFLTTCLLWRGIREETEPWVAQTPLG